MEFFLDEVTSRQEVLRNMERMNACGDRLTGTDGHNAFCDMLESEIRGMGLKVFSKEYCFRRWEAQDFSLSVEGEEIPVSSPFHYSGLTPGDGVTARLKLVGDHPLGFLRARGKIAVIRIKNLKHISSRIAFNKRASLPRELEIEKSYRGPVSTAFVKTLLTFPLLKSSGVKGAVCVWEGMSDEMVEGQCLNFILDYLGVPVLWVNETQGKKVIAAAKAKKSAALKLTGSLEMAKTRSFYTIIEGTDKSSNEAVIVNTHTDGCNFCEENGGVGMLALLKWFKAHPCRRTLIFVFCTGHFRLPVFRAGHLPSDQATGGWLKENKPLWHGEKYKAVAGCSVEHLGCTEWKDRNGIYMQTNAVDTELVYTGNKNLDKLYYEAASERTLLRTMTLRGHNTMHFGEGQPLSKKGIPEIALVTAPDYLCSVDRTGGAHMDKFNLELMYQQLHTFARCIMLLDGKSKKEIGRSQPYSLGIGRLK